MSFVSKLLPVRTPPLNFSVGPEVTGSPPVPLPLPEGFADIFKNGKKSLFGRPGPRRSAAAEGLPPPRPNRPVRGIVIGRTNGPDASCCVDCCFCWLPLLMLLPAVIWSGSSRDSSISDDWPVIGVVVGSKMASGEVGIEIQRERSCCSLLLGTSQILKFANRIGLPNLATLCYSHPIYVKHKVADQYMKNLKNNLPLVALTCNSPQIRSK